MKTNYLLDKKLFLVPRRGGGPWTFLIILIIVFTLVGFCLSVIFWTSDQNCDTNEGWW